MGFMAVLGYCFACHCPISFNPNRVPSLLVDGERQAICSLCHAQWNEIHRTSKGLDPIPLDPEAYAPEECP